MQVCEALADPTRARIVELLSTARSERRRHRGALRGVAPGRFPSPAGTARGRPHPGDAATRNVRVYRLDPVPLRDLETWLLVAGRIGRVASTRSVHISIGRRRTMKTDDLATFDDRRTMRYTRFYPHPYIGADDPADHTTWAHAGTVTEFDPPSLVYGELHAVRTHRCRRWDEARVRARLLAGTRRRGRGRRHPAGRGSPWRTGFVAGFHLMLDQIGALLDGTLTLADAQPYIDLVQPPVAGCTSSCVEHVTRGPRPKLELAARYEAHIQPRTVRA